MIKLTLHSETAATTLLPLADVKTFLRVSNTAEDSLITSFISAAVGVAQNYTNSRFLETEFTMYMETWNDIYLSNQTTGGYVGKDGLNQIVLPYAPLTSITHVKYYDSADAQQTWTADTDYSVHSFINQQGFIEIMDGVSYPNVAERADAIEIKFKAGYGTTAGTVPEAIKFAHVGLLVELDI